MTKIHIERPTSDRADEIAVQIMEGRWRAYCGMEIGVRTVWVSVLHVEEMGGRCKDCNTHMCKRCKAAYEREG